MINVVLVCMELTDRALLIKRRLLLNTNTVCVGMISFQKYHAATALNWETGSRK